MVWKLTANQTNCKMWKYGRRLVIVHKENNLWWIDWGIFDEQQHLSLSSTFRKSKAAAIKEARIIMKTGFVWRVK